MPVECWSTLQWLWEVMHLCQEQEHAVICADPTCSMCYMSVFWKNWDVLGLQELCTDLCNPGPCIITLQREDRGLMAQQWDLLPSALYSENCDLSMRRMPLKGTRSQQCEHMPPHIGSNDELQTGSISSAVVGPDRCTVQLIVKTWAFTSQATALLGIAAVSMSIALSLKTCDICGCAAWLNCKFWRLLLWPAKCPSDQLSCCLISILICLTCEVDEISWQRRAQYQKRVACIFFFTVCMHVLFLFVVLLGSFQREGENLFKFLFFYPSDCALPSGLWGYSS